MGAVLTENAQGWRCGRAVEAERDPGGDVPGGRGLEQELVAAGYRAGVGTFELISEVQHWLGVGRRAESVVCRYLADLADRIRERRDLVLEPYADELQAARCFFGLGARETRERVRIGRALRQLPCIERAFVEGSLSYSRVREVTRVAEPATERRWLELGRELDMRTLERRVAAAQSGGARAARSGAAHSAATHSAATHSAATHSAATHSAATHSAATHSAAASGAGGDANTAHSNAACSGAMHSHAARRGAARLGAARSLGASGAEGLVAGDRETVGSSKAAQAAYVGRAGSGSACGDDASDEQRRIRLPARVQPRAERRAGTPVRTEWLGRDSVRVSFELSADAWALLERALEGARRAAAAGSAGESDDPGAATSESTQLGPTSAAVMSDPDALAAVARDALTAQAAESDPSDPRRLVVVYECPRCGTSALETGKGTAELEPVTSATPCCGAPEVHLASEGTTPRRAGPLPSAIRRAVLLRDHCRCRVPGCNRRRHVDVHSIAHHCADGRRSRRDAVTPCTTHHRLLHEGKLQIEGDADAELVFRDATGRDLGEACRSAGHSAGAAQTADPLGAPHRGLSPEAARLLAGIGRRGGWSSEELIQRTGLSAAQLSRALTQLELQRLISNDGFAISPI